MVEPCIYDHAIDTLTGERLALGVFRGLPLIIVNVGTRGPHADQIAGLESLHQSFGSMGLTVVGVPSNDFGGEPGGIERIRDRLTLDFRVTFLVSLPVRVGGDRPCPLYRSLIRFRDRPVTRDAEKFVIDGEGYVVERFGPEVRPSDAALMGSLKFVLPTIGY